MGCKCALFFWLNTTGGERYSHNMHSGLAYQASQEQLGKMYRTFLLQIARVEWYNRAYRSMTRIWSCSSGGILSTVVWTSEGLLETWARC